MYMPLKLKLQDSGQFYHKMSWYSIKVLTVIFITQFRWESLILRPRKFSYLKKASPFSPSIVSTLGLHLYSLQQMEEKEHISIYVEEVKEMRRTTNQLFGNWVYQSEHNSFPEKQPIMAENINKSTSLPQSWSPLPYPLTSCGLDDLAWSGPHGPLPILWMWLSGISPTYFMVFGFW